MEITSIARLSFSLFLKSRYFDDQSFLEAELGRRPSFAWKSILHGRDLLEKGLKQRVGDVTSLKVWTSLWVEDVIMRAPFLKNVLVDLELSVNDLIDQVGRSWDVAILEEHFFPRDVELILKSKPALSSPDFKVWKHNKSGDYSVKSGYWLANQVFKEPEMLSASMQPSLNGIKDQIWSTLGPTKIKIFMWKVVSGAIPVADRLATKGIKIDPRCQICGLDGESINHVLFTCSLARQVWALSGFPCPENGFAFHAIFHNMHHVLMMSRNARINSSTRRSLPWILWRLWKNRNNLLFEGMVFMVSDIMRKIKEDSDLWLQAQELDQLEDQRSLHHEKINAPCWRPPHKPWLKCNIASSWNKDKEFSGAAWVLRNWKGNVLLHSRRSFGFLKSKSEVELQCCLWAMESMQSLHVHKVSFALESNVFVGAILRGLAKL